MSDDTANAIDLDANPSIESTSDTAAPRDDIEADIRAAMQPSEEERPAEQDEGTTTDAAPPTEAPSVQPTESGSQPPLSWKKELQARWSDVPPEVQAEVLRREGEITAKLAEGSSLGRVMEPYRAQIEQAGLSVDQYVGNVMQNVAALRQHPLQALASLAGQYLDAQSARQLGQYLLGEDTYSEEQVGGASQYRGPDPQTQAQLQQIQTQLALQEFERFKSTKDAQGNAMYQYVDDVRNDMIAELRLDPNLSYADAYQRAVWRNEAVRGKLMDAELEKRKAAAKAQADKAKARKLPAGASNEMPEYAHSSDDVGQDVMRAWRQLGGG